MSSATRRRRASARPFRPGLEQLDDRCVPAVITEFPLNTALPTPQGVTTGPDGNIWYTDPGSNKVGRLDPATNVVTEFTLPTAGSNPIGITTGPDGALWFALFGTDAIGRLDPATGAITEFPLAVGSGPQEIVTGPDGNLWFTESLTDMIGQITPAGAVTEFAVPGAGSTPIGITVGPDDRLWFTQFGSDEIGAIGTDGAVEEFAVPGAGSQPLGIASDGPGTGRLFFTQFGSNEIGRISTAGVIGFEIATPAGSTPTDIIVGSNGLLFFTLTGTDAIGRLGTGGGVVLETPTTAGGMPTGIVEGADGNVYFTQPGIASIGQTPLAADAVTDFNLRASVGPGELVSDIASNIWFTEPGADKIGRLSPTGELVEFSLPNTLSEPQGITRGPDGNIWFAEFGGDRIGRITPAGVLTEFPVTVGTGPRDIVTASDGNLWFTGAAGDVIGVMAPDGTLLDEFAVPGVGSLPFGITLGVGSELWFTQFGSDEIGRIALDGTITEFTLPAGRQPFDVVTGPGGNIWFTEFGGDRIGRLDPSAGTPAEIQASLVEFAVPGAGSQPRSITIGPDGNLYFTQAGSDEIGQITLAGTVTEFSAGITAGAGLAGIIAAPGTVALIFAESAAAQVGTLALFADLTVTKDDGLTTAAPGTTITYTITVTSAATSDTTTATVLDTFPAALTGVSWTAAFAGGATGFTAGTGDINEVVTLPGGGSVTYTVTATIDPAATGTLTNTASAFGSFPDANTADNTATDTTTLTPQVDVGVTKDDGLDAAVPGTSVTYTITVINNGPSLATAVALTDAFPAALSGVTFTSLAAGGATGNTAAGTGNLNDTLTLPPGATVVYTVSGTIDPAATADLVNTATVAVPGGIDTNPANDSATDTNTLTPLVDVGVTKTDGATSSVPGSTITYTVTVSNTGPSVAAGVTLTDALPAGLTGVAFASTAAGGATGNTSGTGDLNETLTLPPGATVVYTITATIDPAATGDLVNTVTTAVPTGTTDSNPANDTATDTNTLTPQVDVGVTKTDGVTTVVAGTPLTYTITVTNSGPSTASGVTLSDLFPAAITSATRTTTATGGATGNTAGTGNIADTLTLPPGSSVTYIVTAATSPTASGVLTNTITATVPGGIDTNPANNTATDTTTLTQTPPTTADLAVTITGGTTGTVGTEQTVTITVTNNGPAAATGVTLDTLLPTGVTNLAIITTQGNINDDNSVTIGNLAPGASATVTVTFTPTRAGTRNLTATASGTETDLTTGNNTATQAITFAPFPPILVFGAGPGGAPAVRVIDAASGTELLNFLAFPADFLGGVSVTQGDVTGDGVPEIIVGAGPGGAPLVGVFDLRTGSLIRFFFAYRDDFRGGVTVAAADITGDGIADVLAGAGVGGSPHVAAFDGPTAAVIRSYFAFDDSFRDGVTVAGGDVNGDGIADIVAGTRQGGAPQIAVFDGPTRAVLLSFFTGDPSFRGGVNVAAADLDGDGRADIIAGAGLGGGPVVAVFDPATGRATASIFAFDQSFRGGVNVAGVDADGDGTAEVLVGNGPLLAPSARLFGGTDLALIDTLDPFPGATFLGGVEVG